MSNLDLNSIKLIKQWKHGNNHVYKLLTFYKIWKPKFNLSKKKIGIVSLLGRETLKSRGGNKKIKSLEICNQNKTDKITQRLYIL